MPLAPLKAEIVFDGSALRKGISKAVSETSRGTKRMSGDFNALNKTIKRVALGIGAIFTGRVIKSFLATGKSLETIKLSLTGLLGSTQKAEKAFKSIQKLAVSVTQGIDDLSRGFQQLASANLESIENLEALANVATLMDRSVGDAAAALRSLETETLRNTLGLNNVSAAAGKFTAELRTGRVVTASTRREFQQLLLEAFRLEKGYRGVARGGAKLFGSATETIRNSVAALSVKIRSALAPALIAIAENFSNIATSAEEWVDANKDAISSKTLAGYEALKGSIEAIANAFGRIQPGKVGDTLKAAGIVGVGVSVGTGLVGPAVGGAVSGRLIRRSIGGGRNLTPGISGAVREGFLGSESRILAANAASGASGAGGGIGGAGNFTRNALGSLGTGFANFLGTLSTLVPVVALLAAGLAVVTGVIQSVLDIINALGGLKLDLSSLLNVLRAVAIGFTTLAKVVKVIFTTIANTVRGLVAAVSKGISVLILAVLKILDNFLKNPVLNKLIGPAASAVRTALTTPGIKGLETVIDRLDVTIKKINDEIVGDFAGLVSGNLTNLEKAILGIRTEEDAEKAAAALKKRLAAERAARAAKSLAEETARKQEARFAQGERDKAAKERKDADDELTKLREKFFSSAERGRNVFEQTSGDLDTLDRAGRISSKRLKEERLRAEVDLIESGGKGELAQFSLELTKTAQESLAQGLSQGFVDAIESGSFDDFAKNLANSVGSALLQAVIEALAAAGVKRAVEFGLGLAGSLLGVASAGVNLGNLSTTGLDAGGFSGIDSTPGGPFLFGQNQIAKLGGTVSHGRILRFAHGGIVPNVSNRPFSDSVPILAQPGERILSVAENRNFSKGGSGMNVAVTINTQSLDPSKAADVINANADVIERVIVGKIQENSTIRRAVRGR